MSATKTKSKRASKAVSEVASRVAALAELKVQNGNWVGALQDAAVESKTALPEYQFGQDVAPAHAPVFVCECAHCGVVGSGKGPTKKAAKQAAAEAWVELCNH